MNSPIHYTTKITPTICRKILCKTGPVSSKILGVGLILDVTQC